MENIFDFNHDINNIYEAIGITKEIENKCSEIIYFSTLSNQIAIRDLFNGDEKSAPKNISTVSGDLEKALSLASTDKEKAYILLIFKEYHDMAIDGFFKYRDISQMAPNEREQAQLMMKLIQLKVKDKRKEHAQSDIEHDVVSIVDIMEKIPYVEKSNFNFNTYYSMVTSDYGSEIDHLIEKAFIKNEQEKP